MSAVGQNTSTGEQRDLHGRPSVALAGLLVLEIVIGYEWLISGLTKIIRGDFPSGLAEADRLAEMVRDGDGDEDSGEEPEPLRRLRSEDCSWRPSGIRIWMVQGRHPGQENRSRERIQSGLD